MKVLIAAALSLMCAGAEAQTLTDQFPSCDLKAQHALKGETGGSIKDPRQAHISVRSNIIQADLGNAVKAGRVKQAEAVQLGQRVDAVRAAADRYTKKQGFLSAAEVATQDRTLDAVAARICHR